MPKVSRKRSSLYSGLTGGIHGGFGKPAVDFKVQLHELIGKIKNTVEKNEKVEKKLMRNVN